MERKNFKASLRESRTALELFSRSLGDQTLFQIGLIHAHPENPSQNLKNSTTAFQKLINNYPNSSLRSQAELWIMHLRRIQDLEATLNAGKQEIGKLHDRLNRIKKNQSQHKKLQNKYIQKIKNQKKEIQGLKRNIKRSKEIDLKIEEKKRKTIP
jgi:predicted RNase H-like nuclease (RuvC/YqgF family)